MSERTASNKKLELMMAPLIVLVFAMLAVPFAISVFRETAIVAFLIQSVPFVLMAVAVASIMWAKRIDS